MMISDHEQQQLLKLHGRIARIRQDNADLLRFVAALREDKDMFSNQIGDQPVYTYRMTPDGAIITASPALIKLLGYASLDELRAKSADNNEYDPAYVQELFAQHAGQITDIESAWRRKDGSIVHVRESATASYDDQGRPIDYQGMIEAITQREPTKLPVIQDTPTEASPQQPVAGNGATTLPSNAPEQHELARPHAPSQAHSSAQLGPAIRASDQQIARSAELTPRRNAMSFPANQPAAQIRETLDRPALKQYAALLWRWAWLIVLGALLGGGAAFGVSSQTIPVYQASTSLLINQARATSSGADYTALLTGERLAKTYAELMRKRPTLEAVIANLKLDGDAEALAKRVTVAPVRDTQLLVLTVEDSDPQRAADIANAIVKVFAEQNQALQAGHYGDTKQSLQRELSKIQLDIDSTQAGLAGLKSQSTADAAERDRLQALLAQYRSNYATLLKSLGDVQLAETQSSDNLNVAESARAESQPVRPRTTINSLLGLIVGTMLSIGIAFLMEYLDDRVKTSEQVSALTGALTLGMIGQIDGSAANGKLVTVHNQQSPLAEAYRMLRVNLDFAAIDRPLRAIAMTSGGPEEGKSTTVANLAVAIAQTGKRVILVDSDLRRPTLHHIFQVSNERGVTTALMNPGDQGVADHLVSSGVINLQLLPSGPIPPNPAELLGSQRMAELIDDLKARAELVLFDTPPLLVFADAALLARVCDGTLLVARARFTRIGALARASDQIEQAGARLLGVVLNQVAMPRGGYDTYYYYYGSRADKQPKRWLGLRWPFARASRSRKHAADEAELARLRDAISSVKRNGTVVDEAIAHTNVPAGGEYVSANGYSDGLQDLAPRLQAAVAASNGTRNDAVTIASGVVPTVGSLKLDQSVARNGNGSYPTSK